MLRFIGGVVLGGLVTYFGIWLYFVIGMNKGR